MTHEHEVDLRPEFKLPAEINVLGQRYSVTVVEDPAVGLARDVGDPIGATDLQRGAIRIRGGGEQGEDQARDTLLHEVLHIVDYFANGGIAQTLPEATIARMSTVLLHTLRTNPELVAAIISR
jgi:hypothetical protein